MPGTFHGLGRKELATAASRGHASPSEKTRTGFPDPCHVSGRKPGGALLGQGSARRGGRGWCRQNRREQAPGCNHPAVVLNWPQSIVMVQEKADSRLQKVFLNVIFLKATQSLGKAAGDGLNLSGSKETGLSLFSSVSRRPGMKEPPAAPGHRRCS